MTKPLVTIYNAETQEQITREMNDVEYEQFLIDKALFEKEKAEAAEAYALAETKKAAKAEMLAALGLSQEVINLLAE